MNVNKVEYEGRVLLDLTEDTVTPENLLVGAVAHDSSGQRIVGTMIQSSGTDTSDATALSEDIVTGKTAYVNGEKVTGSMVALASSNPTVGMGRVAISKGSNDINIMFNNVTLNEQSAYLNNRSSFTLYGDSSLGKFFGDATPEDVRKGKKFTSKDGVATGTMEASGGDSVGVQVKAGTTSSPTINTGLSKIDKLIIYANKIESKGMVDMIYNSDSPRAITTSCRKYSITSKSCRVDECTGFSVSRGTFHWTETTDEYSFMDGTTYNWIAIGS